jgi:DNA (cytosine-5)-methyltransferase 1
MLTYGSVCSGAGTCALAFLPLGVRAVWFAEINPAPSAVLAHRYPGVPNLGDMATLPERIRAREVPAPDILMGGTPCQAFSVAGLRLSLDDLRGNLTLTFCEIANAIDSVRAADGRPPLVVFWENVPGVLSVDDNAFGCFLGSLAGSGAAIDPGDAGWSYAGVVSGPQRTASWRVLDAQYFRVAQRRRRVFVVAGSGAFRPEAVLFESEGVRRDSPPRREAGEGPAPTVAGGARRSGGFSEDDIPKVCGTLGANHGNVKAEAAWTGQLIAGTLQANGKAAGSATQQDAEGGLLVAEWASNGRPAAPGDRTVAVFGGNDTGGAIDVAPALNANRGCHNPGDFEAGALCVTGDVTHALKADGADASEDGTGRGTPIIAFPAEMSGTACASTEDVGIALSTKHTAAVALQEQGVRLSHAKNQGNSRNILLLLRQEAGEEAFAEWGLGILDSLQSQEVLRPEVHGGSVRRPRFDIGSVVNNALSREEVGSAWAMFAVRSAFGERRPPQGWGPHEQHAVELGAYLSLLSQQGAPRQGGLLDLWEASEGLWVLREALSTFQEMGRPTRGEDQPARQGFQVRRLTPRECERLMGWPDDHTLVPYRGKPMADGPRYKIIGNGWALPCVQWIGRRIVRECYHASNNVTSGVT